MLHSGCVKRHQKFRDFVGLPMGLLRDGSPKTRMNTGLFGSWSGVIRSEGCTSCTSVQQAIIDCSDYIKMVQKPRKIKVFRGFLVPRLICIV